MGFNKKISRQSKVKYNDINHELEDSVNTGLEERVDQLEDNIENNIAVSGPAALITNAAPIIVSSLIANITAVQEGTGDPSPENVRAISGFSTVTITQKDAETSPTITNTYSIPLGQTIYGGTLDVNKGLLTITHGYISDWSSYSFSTNNQGTNAFEAYCRITKKIGVDNILSNKLALVSRFTDTADYTIRGSSNDTDIDIKVPISVASSGTEVKQWLIDNSVTLVYELATPTTVQLTPTQIKLLENYNVIMANSGDVELVYQPNNELGKSLVPISDRIDTESSLRPILKSATISGTTSEGGLLATTLTGVPLFVDLSDGTDKLTASFLYGEDDVIVIKSEVSTAVTGTLYYL